MLAKEATVGFGKQRVKGSNMLAKQLPILRRMNWCLRGNSWLALKN